MSTTFEWIRDVVTVPIFTGVATGAYSSLVVSRYMVFQGQIQGALADIGTIPDVYFDALSAEDYWEARRRWDNLLSDAYGNFLGLGHIGAATRIDTLRSEIGIAFEEEFGSRDFDEDSGTEDFARAWGSMQELKVELAIKTRGVRPDMVLIIFGSRAAAFVSRCMGRLRKLRQYLDGYDPT